MLNLRKLAREVEIVIHDGEDIAGIEKDLREIVPDIDRLGNAVGVLNPDGFSEYDKKLLYFVQSVDIRLKAMIDRRNDPLTKPY